MSRELDWLFWVACILSHLIPFCFYSVPELPFLPCYYNVNFCFSHDGDVLLIVGK